MVITLTLAMAGLARAQTTALAGTPPTPADRARIAAFNVALTGSFALARGWIEGHVHSGRDALQIFTSGAVGGYGFYQSKRLIGEEHALPGLALAYASASVVENASSGRHPLAFLRFGPGPVDLQVRTPFARSGQPLATVQVNVFSAAGALMLPLLGYRPTFHSGTLQFTSDDPIGQNGDYRAAARTVNRTILIGPNPVEHTQAHELIHLVQSLQAGAATPYYTLSSIRPDASYMLGGGSRFAWDLQFDWLYGLLAIPTALVDYDGRWNEIEAYSLTENESVEREGCVDVVCALDRQSF